MEWAKLIRFDQTINDVVDTIIINDLEFSIGRRECSHNIKTMAISLKHCSILLENGIGYIIDHR